MSLIETSLGNVVKKQYRYKLKAYAAVFSSLLILQVIGILLSLNGAGMRGTSSDAVHIYVTYHSADLVISLTSLWAFIAAILVTTKAYRYDDFTFVTNRVSSHVSTILFLVTTSLIGGITALLSSNLLNTLIYFFTSYEFVKGETLLDVPSEFMIGLFVTCLHVLLFSAIGYFVGMIVQIHQLFAIILPALFFGFIGTASSNVFASFYHFYFQEESFIIFILKILTTIVLLFIGAMWFTNRTEIK